jgi:hypothetical protein
MPDGNLEKASYSEFIIKGRKFKLASRMVTDRWSAVITSKWRDFHCWQLYSWKLWETG